jgi:membrane-bound metal-dependent hydrolase YbcI (DUF457 family)
MFIGHFAVAFGARKYAPRVQLAWLIAGVARADILWTAFLLLGWEHTRIAPGDTRYTPLDLYDYPWSHSLLMLVVWGVALGAIYFAWKKDAMGAGIVGACVLSHWVLDWVTHRPDMPLYPGGPKFGLGLWNSVAGTMVVEIAMFAAGVWIYFRATRARNWKGKYITPAFAAMLLFVFVADRFSPPPGSLQEVAKTGLIATLIMLAWAWWFDRNREPVVAV